MFKQIVLATDGSVTSEKAAGKAAELARLLGASLTAVFVCTPYPYLIADEKERFVNSARDAANTTFEKVGLLAGDDVPFEGVFLEGKKIDATVTDFLKEKNADLLVVGSHGYSGLDRILLGSVANKLANTAPVPVLIVR